MRKEKKEGKREKERESRKEQNHTDRIRLIKKGIKERIIKEVRIYNKIKGKEKEREA